MPAREEILAAELKVLQAMCAGVPAGTVWDRGMLILDSYAFRDNVHQLVFETLQDINTDQPEIIRQQLPGRLTRKGFPDVDAGKFFAPHGLTAEQAVELMKKLRTWTPGEKRGDGPLR